MCYKYLELPKGLHEQPDGHLRLAPHLMGAILPLIFTLLGLNNEIMLHCYGSLFHTQSGKQCVFSEQHHFAGKM